MLYTELLWKIEDFGNNSVVNVGGYYGQENCFHGGQELYDMRIVENNPKRTDGE